MAQALLLHALRLLFNNLPHALRCSVAPILAGTGLTMLVEALLGNPGPEAPEQAGALLVSLVAGLAINLVAGAWLAVAWYRFVLAEEYPGWLPPFRWPRLWRYLRALVLVALLTTLFSLPVTIAGTVLGSVLYTLGGAGGAVGVLIALIAVVTVTAIGYLSLRLSLCLPTAALDGWMTPMESWRACARVAPALPALALAFVVPFGLLFGAAMLTEAGGNAVLAGAVSLVMSWLTVMFGAALLTTLYGVVVEGRAVE